MAHSTISTSIPALVLDHTGPRRPSHHSPTFPTWRIFPTLGPSTTSSTRTPIPDLGLDSSFAHRSFAQQESSSSRIGVTPARGECDSTAVPHQMARRSAPGIYEAYPPPVMCRPLSTLRHAHRMSTYKGSPLQLSSQSWLRHHLCMSSFPGSGLTAGSPRRLCILTPHHVSIWPSLRPHQ